MKVNVVLSDHVQGTMLVLLWMQLVYAKDGEHEDARACLDHALRLCEEHEELAIELGDIMEHLHKTVGCGEGCQHKPGGSA